MKEMPLIDGPRLMPRGGTRPRLLVVFLHGYGSDGNDLIALGQQWQPLLPDAVFVSPHAPERMPAMAGGRGYQWFPLTMRDPEERWRGVVAARPALDAFLDAELRWHGLNPQALVLVGFSQGTMMALHVGLRRPVAPTAIVGYSGILVGEDRIAAEARCRPPVLLVHGGRDDLIPADALFMSAEALAKAEIPCEWHLSADIGHGIDEEGLRHGGLFIAAAFAACPAARRMTPEIGTFTSVTRNL
jgi:phospholipase/carboxylesterase